MCAKQGGSLYHFHDGLRQDPTRRFRQGGHYFRFSGLFYNLTSVFPWLQLISGLTKSNIDNSYSLTKYEKITCKCQHFVRHLDNNFIIPWLFPWSPWFQGEWPPCLIDIVSSQSLPLFSSPECPAQRSGSVYVHPWPSRQGHPVLCTAYQLSHLAKRNMYTSIYYKETHLLCEELDLKKEEANLMNTEQNWSTEM